MGVRGRKASLTPPGTLVRSHHLHSNGVAARGGAQPQIECAAVVLLQQDRRPLGGPGAQARQWVVSFLASARRWGRAGGGPSPAPGTGVARRSSDRLRCHAVNLPVAMVRSNSRALARRERVASADSIEMGRPCVSRSDAGKTRGVVPRPVAGRSAPGLDRDSRSSAQSQLSVSKEAGHIRLSSPVSSLPNVLMWLGRMYHQKWGQG